MAIKRIKEITAEDENFRIEPCGNNSEIGHIRRDAVEPVPVGTLIVKIFRITGYDKDYDGSLMARMEAIDKEGKATGWTENCIGLYPSSTWQVDSPDDIDKLVEG